MFFFFLKQLNEECLMSLKEEFLNVLKNADNPDIKEVKGIGDRLANLNKLIEDFDKLCNDQNEMKAVSSDFNIFFSGELFVLYIYICIKNMKFFLKKSHKCFM